jgi:hypothetical protein
MFVSSTVVVWVAAALLGGTRQRNHFVALREQHLDALFDAVQHSTAAPGEAYAELEALEGAFEGEISTLELLHDALEPTEDHIDAELGTLFGGGSVVASGGRARCGTIVGALGVDTVAVATR